MEELCTKSYSYRCVEKMVLASLVDSRERSCDVFHRWKNADYCIQRLSIAGAGFDCQGQAILGLTFIQLPKIQLYLQIWNFRKLLFSQDFSSALQAVRVRSMYF